MSERLENVTDASQTLKKLFKGSMHQRGVLSMFYVCVKICGIVA